MGEKKQQRDQFPVDIRPLVRAGALLSVVFIGLCAVTYMQQGSEMYYVGVLFFAAVVAFFAYTQREDSFRVTVILLSGAVLSILLLVFGSGTDEPVAKPEQKRPLNVTLPEGLE